MFIPAAIKVVMARLAPRIEAFACVEIKQIIDLNPAIPKRIEAGEAFDLALTNPPYVRALIESGLVNASSHRPFGRVPLAVARRSDVNVPAATSIAGIVKLFRDAGSIAFTGAGTSGRIYLDAMEQLGLTDAIASKSRSVSGGVPAEMAAAGDVDLAVAPLTTVLATPGVIPAAVFPVRLGIHIDISVFLSTKASREAEHVLEFLTADDLDGELADAGIVRFLFT